MFVLVFDGVVSLCFISFGCFVLSVRLLFVCCVVLCLVLVVVMLRFCCVWACWVFWSGFCVVLGWFLLTDLVGLVYWLVIWVWWWLICVSGVLFCVGLFIGVILCCVAVF